MRFPIIFSLVVASAVSATTTSAKCSRHPRVRKEWRDIGDDERLAFIDAVKCLGTIPHSSKLEPTGVTPNLPPLNTSSSYYDDFVYAHMDSNVKDHFTALFLPWHRWYLHTFEAALKDKCGFKGTIPFWDWSRDVSGIPKSPVFSSSLTHGLGTLDTPESSHAVTNGAFGTTIRAYPTPHVVQRNFTLYPFRKSPFPFKPLNVDLPATEAFTPKAIANIVKGSKGNYTDFAYMIDGVRAQGPHNAAHLMLGGDMANPLWSPNDPLFWIHHAHIDCIWARWQAKNSENLWAYGGGLTQNLSAYDRYPVGAPPKAHLSTKLPTRGLGKGSVWVKDVMVTRNEYLCYKCDY
ncbi:Di-copper centre-containing protein [Ceratobasidium sp. AG-I]|nr:Di-copper centre-containing protein [Ceratobasidium sp. AG-I]